MTRGLPISILIHVLTLGLVLVFGNSVNQRPYEAPRTIGVHLVELPKVEKPKTELVEDIKIVEPPKPKPKVEEKLPAKELPKPKKDPEPKIKPDPPKEVIPEKKPPVETSDEPVDSSPAEDESESTPAVALPAGASVAGTDTNFPYAYYLSVMEGQVARVWNPKQAGFRDTGISCVVHFTIQRSGSINQVTLTRSSGIGVFDRDALRAVQSVRLAQLPGEFGSNTLGVTMTFNLESGD